MVTRIPALALAGFFVLCSSTFISGQRGNPLVQFGGQSIDQMIAAFMAERQIPGVTLAIVQAPYISRAAGYGVTDTETRRLASPNTLWNVGQMARAYTAVAIWQLVEAGKLKIDDPAGTHVTGLPPAWQAATVRQLLAHASGLPDYTAQPAFDPARTYTRAQLLALVRDVPIAFAPGARVAESATDFLLLGLVVEHASGMSYEAFVTKNQFERLHLRNTVFGSGLPSVKQEALDGPGAKHKAFLAERPFIDPTEASTGYTLKNGALAPVRAGVDSAWYGHGAIFASATDISLWDIGLAGGQLVAAKEHRDAIYGPAAIGGGAVPANAGWRFPKHKGLMDIAGSVPGSSCYLARFTDPGELLCVTLCGNRDSIDFTDLGRRIAGAFDPKLGPPSGGPKTSRESTYPVATTAERLASFLKSKGADVSSRTAPSGGTQLSARVAGAREVTLRVWQEGDGTIWAGYDDVDASIRAAIEAAVKHATAPY